MQTLETMKSRSQESINRLVNLGKQQPEQVQTWGITAAAAVAGAVALAATAQGLLAILVTLAAPPVALTVGAIGGGLAGWSFLQSRKTADATHHPEAVAPERVSVVQSGEAASVDPKIAS